jgi:conjugative transfer signal peptidase TraF
VLGALSYLPLPPRLVWNFTPSAPLGLYLIDPAAAGPGDLLAIAPDGIAAEALHRSGALAEGRVLLKPLAARAGDIVCRHGAHVLINGVAAATARETLAGGQPLPMWNGCIQLDAASIFVLSPHPLSFDARYFGPVSTDTVLGVARPLLTFPVSRESAR